MKSLLPWLALSAAALTTLPAFAADTVNGNDQWVLRFGAATVHPDSDTGHLAGMKAKVDSSTRPSIDLEYLLTPNWGIDVLGALPFRHEVRLNGTKAATTKQLPPTVGINYHFMPNEQVSPFVGAGINFTHFYDSRGEGLLKGAHVTIDDSWGVAARAGVDFKLNDSWLITADLRWIRIRSDVKVGGTKVGQARIDPIVYGFSVGYRF
ncbi:outer membrane beta-barrel protein [Luteibacter flocculans]|uniref:Outer membrane beta-barrel protein n=1 Tax=Luteibacter flocculans TaxID=2780091 RepID=A0ABY4T5F8_9GAMM|nr:OmpW family outer membrane protein [Luteibacter flocculans]URL60128.1 outer membrane beta-barrel protein [Luteibacter flocculans]